MVIVTAFIRQLQTQRLDNYGATLKRYDLLKFKSKFMFLILIEQHYQPFITYLEARHTSFMVKVNIDLFNDISTKYSGSILSVMIEVIHYYKMHIIDECVEASLFPDTIFIYYIFMFTINCSNFRSHALR